MLKRFPPSHIAKINQSTNQDWPANLTLIFGKQTSSEIKPIYVSSAGWSIYISTERPCTWNTNHTNKLAAMYAGALAVGEVFKYMIGNYQKELKTISTLQYDLVTHGRASQPVLQPSIPGMMHFESLTIVGCGAIGQALVLALVEATKLFGIITLVDPDKLDSSNEQRYLLAFAENRGISKTEILQKVLTKVPKEMMVVEVPLEYERMASGSELPLIGPEVVATVDNSETRVNVQAGLPKVLWNAWTDTGLGKLSYGLGRHTLDGSYQCMGCSYFPDGESPSQLKMASIRTGLSEDEISRRLKENDTITEQDVERVSKNTGVQIQELQPNIGKPFGELLHGDCGVFRMLLRGKHETTPAPHTPVLAGILAASQLILSRLQLPDLAKPIESAAEFDALSIPNEDCIMRKQRNPACFCNDPIYREAYQEKWKDN